MRMGRRMGRVGVWVGVDVLQELKQNNSVSKSQIVSACWGYACWGVCIRWGIRTM